jgi:LAS superfamily LD-carboxypeptidase LdcB
MLILVSVHCPLGIHGSCGNYASAPVLSLAGNGNVTYSVVKIRREHLTNPSLSEGDPTTKDNTMTTAAACAFDKMSAAAKKAGVTITIDSAFRTFARQEYFYNCFLTKTCNGGNPAAKPGMSTWGRGSLLDLNVNCPTQVGPKPTCDGDAVYQWLARNAHTFGFTRTIQRETGAWEFIGASATPASFAQVY